MSYMNLLNKKIRIREDHTGFIPAWLTVGKIYEVVSGSGEHPEWIIDDDGQEIAINANPAYKCGHLECMGGWEVVEE